ncbi:hypothetical protein SGRA_0457 [Saprospira grandis str. Lewin]|uniref:Uncharacterized protein n=1 Tax=Saprospira grandis (strain Lewin) TaxID=984262 RepID=H6L9L8_SAPGL|nr:hypothetical protein SGRA_0457 [Saprospira grandis str. Lewin]
MRPLALGPVFCLAPSSMPPLEAPAKLGKRECFKQVLFIPFFDQSKWPKSLILYFFYYLKIVIIP